MNSYTVGFSLKNTKYMQSTPDNSNLLGILKIVRIIGSSKKMTGNKEISKMDGRKCKYHAYFTSRAVRDTD